MSNSRYCRINQRSVLRLFLQSLFGLMLSFFSTWGIAQTPAPKGKLAIVIDDVGYRQKEDNAIYALPNSVSVAIIHVAPHATARAKQAFSQQRDVLIHLPMQPQNNVPIETDALRVGMNEHDTKQLIDRAYQKVPHAIGLNNHMGSRATRDKTTMQHLMKALSAHQLFFLDSKTAGDSVAMKTAREFGLSGLERDIFLDDSNELADVARQFERAVSHARHHGKAILIGHPRKNSIAVLQKGIANLPKDIQLVSMGHLWRAEKVQPAKPFTLIFAVGAPTSSAPFQAVPLLRGVPKE